MARSIRLQPAQIRRLFTAVAALYLAVTILLPGGTLYGVNFKAPVYLLLLPLAGYSFFETRRASAAEVAGLLAVPAVFSLWILIGLGYGFAIAGAIRQYADLLLTLFLCWLVPLCNGQNDERKLAFLRLVLVSEVVTALMKGAIVAYAFTAGVPVVSLMERLEAAFGVQLMKLDLGAVLGRVQFISDALIPVCLYLLLRHRKRLRVHGVLAAGMMFLLLLSVLISFSRYLWAFSALAVIVGLVIGERDRFKLAVLGVLLAVSLASLPLLIDLYSLRFSQGVAGISDADRVEQIPVLRAFALDAPVFGHGLGSYSTALLRDTTSETGRFSYEVQLLALAGQMGCVGLALLLCLLLMYYRNLWRGHLLGTGDRVGLATLLCTWIAAGMYNPLLLHPVAGVNYAVLYTLANLGSRQPAAKP